jgi:hypothetical protein
VPEGDFKATEVGAHVQLSPAGPFIGAALPGPKSTSWMSHVDPVPKPFPVMVTLVPPAVFPASGFTLSTSGGVEYVKVALPVLGDAVPDAQSGQL